jgi:hypothetical protein
MEVWRLKRPQYVHKNERKVVSLQYGALTQDYGALYGMTERTHVSRPGMRHQFVQRSRAQPPGGKITFLRIEGNKVFQQKTYSRPRTY